MPMNIRRLEQLASLYDAYAARLTLYARQWQDQAGAEDAVQEVFLKLTARQFACRQERRRTGSLAFQTSPSEVLQRTAVCMASPAPRRACQCAPVKLL